MQSMASNLATLRVTGPDGKGIVASCSNLLDRHGYGIFSTEHWTERCEDRLFLRIVFDKESSNDGKDVAAVIGDDDEEQRQEQVNNNMIKNQELETPSSATMAEQELAAFCRDRNLQFELNWRNKKPKIAIMASKSPHCVWELMLRHQAREIDCDIVAILSNHDELQPVAETFDIPYHVFPITTENKPDQEVRQLTLLRDEWNVDLVVLARYMQVLSSDFLDAFPDRTSIINIHHSFLPAFSGSRPYHAAHARGVKLIGATAHYVTPILDDGPIIEQDVISVTHRDGINGLIRKGRILERNVLVRAIQAHLDDRVILYKNKCVVFGD